VWNKNEDTRPVQEGGEGKEPGRGPPKAGRRGRQHTPPAEGKKSSTKNTCTIMHTQGGWVGIGP
jgi:hypothetical protein